MDALREPKLLKLEVRTPQIAGLYSKSATTSLSNLCYNCIEPYQAIELLKYVDEGASDMTEEVTNDIESQLSAGDKAAVAADVLKKQSKRPPLNFKTMGIPMDAILTYTKDKNITFRVCSDRKVVFEDEITSLTAVTKKLLNTVHAPQPTPHWSYNGTNLQDLYDETFPFED